MAYSFSLIWLIIGLIMLAGGGAMVISYRQISDNFGTGYDRTKQWGIIIAIAGLLSASNLLPYLLNLIVYSIFVR